MTEQQPSSAAPFDQGVTLADRMRTHASDNQHLYGHLMRRMADDFEADGPVRVICAGWEDSPRGASVQLRLLAGLFRIVLTGRAPELVPYYPCLGGSADPADAWPVVRLVMQQHLEELHEALDVAPQTNEVTRCNALLVGLFEAVRRTGLSRIRLLEPGASAGLNLLVDRFRFEGERWEWGPQTSPVLLRDAVIGPVGPLDLSIVERRGCDLSPVDASSPAGRLRLRSFVWPFHLERHELLTDAFEVATDDPPVVDESGAADWLDARLAESTSPDVLTVVWHSITRMYWPEEESDRAAEVIREAAGRLALAHLSMEFPRREGGFGPELVLAVGPQQEPVVLADVGDHGRPVTIRL